MELKEHFKDKIFQLISETADELALECYVVGGYVRDIFLNRPSKDIDVVVNASYSEMHYPITKDLLLHGFNVLVEKPFAANYHECADLIKTAEDNGVVLAVFQQTFLAPFYQFAKELIASGKLGEIKQASIRYNNLSRRWDWQTLQCELAGGIYNTGPHPIGLAVDLLDYSEDIRACRKI